MAAISELSETPPDRTYMRHIQAVIVSVFFAMLAFPLAQMIFPIVRISPVEENRLPAQLPDFAETVLRGDGRVATQLNRWFDDRVGFRPLFIRAHNQLDYSLLGHSDRVYIGRDETLFLRSYVETRVNYERGGEAWQEAVRLKFTALADYLDRNGIRLVIVSNPSKESVLAELLPADAPRLPSPTQFDRLRRFLSDNPRWIHVDGQEVMGQCGHYPIFYRTDIHLTMPAGYCLAKEIVARIAVAEGRPAEFWNPSFTYRPHRFSGGLATFLALLRKPTEMIDLPDVLHGTNDNVSEGSFSADPNGFFEMIYRTDESRRAGKLPPMVLYGNSFAADYLRSGLFFQFAEVHSVKSNEIPIEAALLRLPASTRYLIVQFLEPYTADFLQYQIPE
jgi:hypothetical protein